ncbi:DUF6817 domain-containing protein [Thermocatellispora tengchongensis]|uniref:DUF6817 domain-containing protein n=1 Tax=Thermocatellispora tengchongensis TaxID=1073253 RepID=UPI001620F71C
MLRERGAAETPHPGGTLLAHLQRVHDLLESWGARPALRLAGLCHAYYGTDGFRTALGDVRRRHELAEAVGAEAEELVYFYASCDRAHSYPRLAEGGEGAFRDRFTGVLSAPPPALLRDFAELTVANELDVLRADAGLRERHGAELRALFGSWRHLLSEPAARAVARELGPG